MEVNNETLDVFAALLASHGQEDGTQRTALVSVLAGLAGALTRHDDSCRQNISQRETEPLNMDELLEIEEAASNVRKASANFLAVLESQIEQAVELGLEMEAICRSRRECDRLLVVSRAIVTEFRKQKNVQIMSITRTVQRLQEIYMPTHSNRSLSSEFFLELVEILNHTDDEESSHIRGILSLFEALREGTSPTKPVKMNIVQHGSKFAINDKALPLHPGDHQTIRVDGFPFPLSDKKLQKIMLVGSSGSGKTHICDQIQNLAGKGSVVVRPEIVGRKVGEAEDIVASLFHFAHVCTRRYILLFDDFERVVGGNQHLSSTVNTKNDRERHCASRSMSTFLAMMDACDSNICRLRFPVLILCTTTANINEDIARFDKVYVLENPGYEERRKLIASSLIDSDVSSPANGVSEEISSQLQHMLEEIAASTVGMSYGELSFYCRQALFVENNDAQIKSNRQDENANRVNKQMNLLMAMKASVQSMVPPSLRNGLADDSISLRVLTNKELLSSTSECPISCPLLGQNADTVWRNLQSQIVVPLCRANALNGLMNTESGPGPGKMCGGVLLTGEPGTGKSVIARYCASYAAKHMPSVKLLEVTCTSLIHMEVGASERAVRRMFECARALAPCVVVLDEVATISSVRGNDTTTEGTMDRVLSTLLTELDGVDESPSATDMGGTAVIGITQNVSWVDPALLRPGRLGKVLRLEIPDDRTRFLIAKDELEQFFIQQLQMEDDEALGDDVRDLAQTVAEVTKGLAGANVIAVCNDVKQACISQQVDAAQRSINRGQILDAMRRFLSSRQSTTTEKQVTMSISH